MLIDLLKISILMIAVAGPFFIRFKLRTRKRKIRIPKNHNDTSEARYAINENGFLEEISYNRFKSHVD